VGKGVEEEEEEEDDDLSLSNFSLKEKKSDLEPVFNTFKFSSFCFRLKILVSVSVI
jgi:hypothetical protein